MDRNAEVLAQIIDEMTGGMEGSRKARAIAEKISQGKATYADALDYARESGRIMNGSLRKNLPKALTNGKLYRADADQVVRKPMERSGKQVAEVAAEIQQRMNEEAGIGIRAITPEVNEDQITGIITDICNAESYEDGKERLFTQIENFLEGTVDDCVRENADFQYQAGLSPKIERRTVGKCCEWCSRLAGTYDYEDVRDKGNDVFRRHKNCHCIVSYNPGDGSKRRQNAHTKRWTAETDPDIIEQRKSMNLDLQQFGETGAIRAMMFKDNWQKASLKETVNRFAKGAKPDKRGRGKTYYTSKDGKFSVVYDRYGNYFRILDNTAEANHEKKPCLNLEGQRVMTDRYEQETHFLNTDTRGKKR